MAAGGSRGVVLFPRDRSTAADAVHELQRVGVAVVVVDRYFPSLPTDAVIFDDFAVGYQVTEAMLERGHRAPAMLWSESEVTSVRDRQCGHYRRCSTVGSRRSPSGPRCASTIRSTRRAGGGGCGPCWNPRSG